MKMLRLLALLTAGSLPSLAVEIGDSHAQVIAEKGAPTATLQLGETQVLNYPGERIKLKAGKVVAVTSVEAEPVPTIPAGTWTTNYSQALEQARAENTKVFVFFTGSDWCGWCKRLDAEILSKPEFKSYAEKNLILVKLDFPQGIPQSPALKQQNKKLAQQYKIRGYPSIVVLDSEGKPVGALGYQKGGPAPFIAALKKM